MASKIVKPAGAQPDELELSVAQALLDLETSVPELKQVQITAVKEVNIRK
jgi:small subunit ribosomal protein S7e